MNWNTLLDLYIIFMFIFSVTVVIFVSYDLISGRYKRFNKLHEDFTDLQNRVEELRKQIKESDRNHD